MLALDCLLYFAAANSGRMGEILLESVEAGDTWCVPNLRFSIVSSAMRRSTHPKRLDRYPFALMSIHMTSFVLNLGASVSRREMHYSTRRRLII